jgi:hypothetical protein
MPSHRRRVMNAPTTSSSGHKRGRGRPTKFREEYVERVRALCDAGVTDEDIAACLGVSSRCLLRWQERWPQFFEARELKHDPSARQKRDRHIRALHRK